MSKPLTMYWYAKCSTCRDAVKSLQAKQREIAAYHDLFEAPPERDALAQVIANSGLPVKSFFNVNGLVYKELQLKDKLPSMTDDEKIDLLAADGRLVKRPAVTDGTQVTIGYKEEEYERVWSLK